MFNKSHPAHIQRCTTQLERLRARAAKLARQLPIDDGGLVEMLDSCLSLSDGLLRDLSGACLANEALGRQLSDRARWWTETFMEMPIGCLEVDASGSIERANVMAAQLFNTGVRHLQGRNLLPFVQDRDGLALLLREATFDRTRAHQGTFIIRPRERAPLTAEFTVLQRGPEDDETRLWFVTRSETSAAKKTGMSRRRLSAESVTARGLPPA
jgi:PAS domain-containing protein